MSLFQCDICGARENTALSGGYWKSAVKKCSECETGVWHDEFPKLILPLGEFKTDRHGNLEHIDGLSLAEWQLIALKGQLSKGE